MIEPNEEVIDMDEVSKSAIILDESNIEDDADEEPDSELDDDDDIDEVDEEDIEEVE